MNRGSHVVIKKHFKKAVPFFLVVAVLGSALPALGETSRASKLRALQSQLKHAATAEESYRTQQSHYTKRMWDLETNEGFTPREDVRILIPRAYDEYCLEGQHDGLSVIWHYDSTVGQPQKGRCSSH